MADDSDIQIVATRIAWGKFMNAGQTCIAPDYILCSENVIDRLIEGLKVAVQAFYGSPEIGGEKSYGKIINDKHMNRLVKLINDNEETKIPLAPQWDKVSMDERIIPPYVFKGVVPENSSLMKEEIFGPLLPIISVPSIDQAIDYIRCHDKPLALYLFTNDKLVIDKVLSGTSSGGVCINDTFMHSLLNTLPFGGVGPSGLGRYHGKHSFDTFSHTKSVQWTGQSGEWLNTPRYPPLTFNKLKVLESLLFTNSP